VARKAVLSCRSSGRRSNCLGTYDEREMKEEENQKGRGKTAVGYVHRRVPAETPSLRGANRWALLRGQRKRCVPCGQGQGGHLQTSHRAYITAQFRHPPFGKGNGSALYSDPLRAQCQQDHGNTCTEPAEVYTHVSTKALGNIRSPLDDLDL